MDKTIFLALAATLPVWAAELPPVIPAGPITYDDVSYAPADTPAETEAAPAATYVEPVTPAGSSEHNLHVTINPYTSNYQVRGMGVTNDMNRYGCSGVGASYTFPNRNLFGRGIQQRISGSFGVAWGAKDALGDTPGLEGHYALGKEVFPNLLVEGGYTVRHGGLEGYMARAHGRASHRLAQDINLSISFDDHQRGFFGGIQWGYGFQGLKGHYMDFEGGYRFTDVFNAPLVGADLEVSAGIAPSFGYWGPSVEGVDAYRLRFALAPYTHSGSLGRDSAWQIKPWVQCSWSGNNDHKIDRCCGYGPVDHFQVTVGIEVHFRF